MMLIIVIYLCSGVVILSHDLEDYLFLCITEVLYFFSQFIDVDSKYMSSTFHKTNTEITQMET